MTDRSKGARTKERRQTYVKRLPTCPHGMGLAMRAKESYRSEAAARKTARQASHTYDVYKCRFCPYWHLTTRPVAMSGPRDEMRAHYAEVDAMAPKWEYGGTF